MTDVEFRPHLSNRIYGYALRIADAICAFTSREIAASRDENYLVSGGVNGRDWKTFAEAVEALPCEIRVFAKIMGESMPPNVIVKWVSRDQFYRNVAAASCVVLPLLPEKLRCSGTTSWTAAMAMARCGLLRAWNT